MNSNLDDTSHERAHWLGVALQPLRDNLRAYVAINILYYGVIVIGMFVVLIDPSIQEQLWKVTKQSLAQGPLAPVADAYSSGNVVLAGVLTFVINLFLGSILWMTIPSMVIPFVGLISGAWRAFMWGLLFCPVTDETASLVMLPHALTLVLEGQAYVLAMLGVYLHGKNWLRPQNMSHRQGYVLGINHTLRIYALIIPLLLVTAAYEAIEVIYFVPAVQS